MTVRVHETSLRPTAPGIRAAPRESPPKLFECKLCGKVFDSDEDGPSCPECDSKDVEQVG
jgi:hypothetical protein